MRNISPALAAHLAGDSLTIATCIRLVRRDGAAFGFTTASDPLIINGLVYQPSAGLDSSTLKSSAGTGVDNLDMTGLLPVKGSAFSLPTISGNVVTSQDLRAGRYDGAELMAFVVNFLDLSMGVLILARGNIGEVVLTDGLFKAEFRSLSQRLAQQVGDVTSATCPVRALGDAQCKVPMAGNRFAVSVASVVDVRTLTVSGRAEAADWFRYGALTPSAGLNAGIVMGISAHAAAGGVATLTLRESFPFAVSPGDAMTLETGCDRTWATCKAKFGNAVNFRGQPFVPGNNTLLEQGRS